MPISPELQAKIDSLSYDPQKKRIMDVLSLPREQRPDLDIQRIKSASTLQEIQAVVRRYPAAAAEGGILYSGPIRAALSHDIATD